MSIHTVADKDSQSFVFTPLTAGTSEEIDASGTSQVDISVVNPRYPTYITLNLAAYDQVTANFHLTDLNFLNVTGDATSVLRDDGISDLGAARAIIHTSVLGGGTFNLSDGGLLEFGKDVASGTTVNLNGTSARDAELKFDQPNGFQGTVNFADGQLILVGLSGASSYGEANGQLTIYGVGDTVIDQVKFNDVSPEKTGITVRLDPQGEVRIAEQGANVAADAGSGFLSGTALTQHALAVPAPVVLIHDITTNADVPDTFSHPYTGPVAGVQTEVIDITPDNLNIMATADSLFIKTGAGNDAIALHGGTNVVDAGGGSNFLTSGGGFDTFFLDARNIPAAASAAGPVPGAIWDTIQNFGHGDAATLWGIGPGTALVWQKNEGAVGHTGLTLHANLPNGSEASFTLAGIDSRSNLSLNYGSSGGASYLYLKAA